jgi:hypothetical protein
VFRVRPPVQYRPAGPSRQRPERSAVLSRIVGVLVVLGSATANVTQVWLLLWAALVVGLGWSAVVIALAGQSPSSF